MKKLVAIFLVLAAMMGTMAFAEDLGVQVIGGPNVSSEPLSLDDMKLGETYSIDGYAKVKPVEYLVVDFFAQFKKDANYTSVGGSRTATSADVFVDNIDNNWYYNWRWWDAQWKDSGVNADFIWLLVDLTNLQKTDVNFMENASVKVVYQDDYEFAGWIRQVNYDYINYGTQGRDVSRYEYDTKCPNVVVLDPVNVEDIGMLYTGTYAFGATLPNSVISDTTSPVRIEITLGENELTYHIRK